MDGATGARIVTLSGALSDAGSSPGRAAARSSWVLMSSRDPGVYPGAVDRHFDERQLKRVSELHHPGIQMAAPLGVDLNHPVAVRLKPLGILGCVKVARDHPDPVPRGELRQSALQHRGLARSRLSLDHHRGREARGPSEEAAERGELVVPSHDLQAGRRPTGVRRRAIRRVRPGRAGRGRLHLPILLPARSGGPGQDPVGGPGGPPTAFGPRAEVPGNVRQRVISTVNSCQRKGAGPACR